MILLDANVLIYSHHSDMREHTAAREWLEKQLTRPEPIGLPWLAIWAFIRISSNPQIWRNPKTAEDLFDRIDEWLTQPNVVIVEPGPRHHRILRSLILTTSAAGNGTTDAALAALAIEHAATLASTDRDFRRFSGLRWVNPLDLDQA
ncbi:MAG TPA: TA system VapC family ribonuclease toxin [Bryobacteraceae bacterium]|jgi:toxin-antitoxin system PIN domain toxin|nr:TA system VapC family ribonuclease toxin [Bryobacteraceae bacterium]